MRIKKKFFNKNDNYIFNLIDYIIYSFILITFFSIFSISRVNGFDYKLFFYTCISIIFFISFYKNINFKINQKKPLIKFKRLKLLYLILILFNIIGLVVTIYAATYSSGFLPYINSLISSDFTQNLRIHYEASSDEGGISGLLKIFTSLIYIPSLTILYLKYKFNFVSNQLFLIYLFSICSLILKSLFSLDILTLIHTFLFFIMFNLTNKKFILKFLLSSFLLFLFIQLIIFNRVGTSIYSILESHLYLGFNNLSLLIDTYDGYDYGTQSFFNVIIFIYEYLGYDYAYENYQFNINPAQNIFGNSYLNFQEFGFIEFILYAYLLRLSQYLYINDKIFAPFIFFVPITIISCLGVPIFKGIEFLLILAIIAIIQKYFIIKHEYSF